MSKLLFINYTLGFPLQKILVRKLHGKHPLGGLRHRLEDITVLRWSMQNYIEGVRK
jgi:hypothetical protein